MYPLCDLVTKVSVNGVKQQPSRGLVRAALQYGLYGGNKHSTYLSKSPKVNTLNKNKKNILEKFSEIWRQNKFLKYKS